MARNEIHIDWNDVDSMLSSGCTGTEIASVLGIHPDTLYKRCEKDNKMGFSDYSAQKRAIGYQMLKQARMEKAMNGDTSMQIWLSKQWFNESDKKETKIEQKESRPPIKWNDD